MIREEISVILGISEQLLLLPYKRIKRATKENNRNIDMSMGLGEEKKLKGKTDQKEEKPSSSSEAITTPSSPLSEMKETADMGPDNSSKVFSQVEEKQQLNP